MAPKWRRLTEQGFHGYSVSNEGDVRNDDTERILKVGVNPRGHKYVGLYSDRIRRTKSVSHLVCEAFHGPAPQLRKYVLHKDSDPLNCSARNLAWRSKSYLRQYYREMEDPQHITDIGRRYYDAKTQKYHHNRHSIALEYGICPTHIELSILDALPWPLPVKLDIRKV